MFSANTSQVSQDAVFIEDTFSSYVYTGNGSTQTITNGIDLSTKGGLIFIKDRTNGGTAWSWVDTARGIYQTLESQNTGAQTSRTTGITAFNTTGFTMGSYFDMNTSATNYASWTFRKQPKFFDVVTYTGNGSSQNIAHNLGSVPGCIIVKSTSTVNDWRVYHRSLATVDSALRLNSTAAVGSSSTFWNSTAPTSTQFTVGSDGSVNANGATYVAYLFAHNAGGFGLTGTDNVISCGSYTTDSSGYSPFINLGFEPQWILTKQTNGVGDWYVTDIMRGMPAYTTPLALTYHPTLFPNTSGAESSGGYNEVTPTGFYTAGNGSSTYIYIAIRRGPMKTPTDATKVFTPVAQTGDSNISVGFPTDFGLRYNRAGGATIAVDRLRGAVGLYTPLTDAESAASTVKFDQQNLMTYGLGAGASVATYQWRRAPGFFDEVCYTGTGSATTQAHNLGVVPELIIVKQRNVARSWAVGNTPNGWTNRLLLDQTVASSAQTSTWNDTAPTSTVFTVGTSSGVNLNGGTYVAYLFASCPGVSKCGSYTGTGTTQQIDCGFTGGARFVLIKRTDSTGDWYVWDSARGIVAGNDPYLLLNSTAAEVTNTDYVDTYAAGFEISSTAPAAINANGGTFIYLAIA